MKILVITIFLALSVFASKVLQPTKQYISSGGVFDIVVDNNKLYSATDMSCVDIFDIKSAKIVKKITLSKIEDFMGDLVDSKVYSVDVYKDKILILSQAKNGFRRVHIYENGKLNLLISSKDQLYIAKAKFLDENRILLGLLSSELISYDIKKRKRNWLIQVSASKFSDFSLNEDRTKVVVADESGDLKIHNTKNGKFIKRLKGKNLDNVFEVDFKNGVVATAGKDRRVVIYNLRKSTAYYKSSSFLIYSVGLSPSGKRAAYSSDENNDVTLFDVASKKDIAVFGGNKMTLNRIVFVDENSFFVATDDNKINFYKQKDD